VRAESSRLEQREKDVYPAMPGYKLGLAAPGYLESETAEKMPDALRADQFAFVTLPVSELFPGGDIDGEPMAHVSQRITHQ
jgi:hypothetical protein